MFTLHTYLIHIVGQRGIQKLNVNLLVAHSMSLIPEKFTRRSDRHEHVPYTTFILKAKTVLKTTHLKIY